MRCSPHIIALLLLGTQGAIAADFAWPQFRHDGPLTGRSSLPGDIVTPRRVWSISLAAGSFELEVIPQPGRHRCLVSHDSGPLCARRVPASGPTLLDIDGTGQLRPAPETWEARWAQILPDRRGWQQVTWNRTWTTAPVCRLQLFHYEQGFDRPQLVWESEPEDTVFMPLCVVHDIDHDGVQEICVALHYRVMIYEGTTGRKETELRFHSSRSYGWFGLADVDADDQMELIVLSDFQSHFDVLDYDASQPEADRLSVKWRREIEQQIEQRSKCPRVGPRPLVDVTSDDRPEIVVNLFNDQGDGQWHVVVLDASTGDVLCDLPRRYVHGTADVDGDGKAEMMVAASSGGLVPTTGDVEVVRCGDAGPQAIWRKPAASFALADLSRFDSWWTTGATLGMRHVLLSDHAVRPALLVISTGPCDLDRPAGPTAPRWTAAAIRFDPQSIPRTLWEVEGWEQLPEGLALETADDGVSATLRLNLRQQQSTTLVGTDAAPALVARAIPNALPSAPIVAALQPGGLDVVVAGAANEVFCIRGPPQPDEQPSIRWRCSGRGISQAGSVVAVDLDDDRLCEVVIADQTVSGAAQLKTVSGSGDTIWSRTFHDIMGGVPVHNVGGLGYWWPGHFRNRQQVDLFVNNSQGLMHSDVGHLLDGRTGEIVWTQHRANAAGQFEWGYAGAPVAVADLIARGRDQIVNLYPVCFWLADGVTGELVAAQELAARQLLPAWAAYGQPMVYDFDRDGAQEVLLDSPYILALLDAAGMPIWHGQPPPDDPSKAAAGGNLETTTVRHALIDFDGDGNMEIASGGYHDGVRAIDPSDGTLLWSLATPTPTQNQAAAADVDGNGGDELLIVAGTDLVAVTGDRTSGRILWTWSGPAPLSLPAIADVDGDGRAEIVVQSADGIVHCIDSP